MELHLPETTDPWGGYRLPSPATPPSAVLFDDDGGVTHFAWPGAYRVHYVTDDAACLCAECVQTNLGLTTDPTNAGMGWFVVGYFTDADAEELPWCDHCGVQR